MSIALLSLLTPQLTGVDAPILIECRELVRTETRTVERSWRERLFSRPWHPLQRERIVVVQVPLERVIRIGGMIYIAHPAVAAKLRQTFLGL